MSAGMPDIWQPVSGRRAGPMSALGHKQTSRRRTSMSALSPKADIARRRKHVRLVPLTDIRPPDRDHAIVSQLGDFNLIWGDQHGAIDHLTR